MAFTSPTGSPARSAYSTAVAGGPRRFTPRDDNGETTEEQGEQEK